MTKLTNKDIELWSTLLNKKKRTQEEETLLDALVVKFRACMDENIKVYEVEQALDGKLTWTSGRDEIETIFCTYHGK